MLQAIRAGYWHVAVLTLLCAAAPARAADLVLDGADELPPIVPWVRCNHLISMAQFS